MHTERALQRLHHVVLMSAVFVLSVVQTARAQGLSNGGFEGAPVGVSGCANVTGQIAQGWSDNTCWDGSAPAIEYALDSTNPHGGLTSQRIALKRGGRVQFVQWLSSPLAKATSYEGRVWLRGQGTDYVTVTLRQVGEPYRPYLSKLIRLTPEWRQYVFNGVAEAVDAAFFITAEKPVTFWVDDASFEPLSTPPLDARPTAAIAKTYFGMHFNYLDTPWPAVGGAIGAVRVWDAGERADNSGTGAQWADISPARGVYDWSGLDVRVDAAQARGADVLMTLGGRTPRWASARPDETSDSPGGGSSYGPGQAAEPANVQDWRDWVRAVATRYKGQIKYWEIWNEPMFRNFYTGAPHTLVELWREAHGILKSVDPENRVLTPSGDLPYLDYLLSSGGLAYTDIVNTHYYVDKPEDVFDVDGQNILRMLKRVGADSRPLWNSEAGWLDFSQPPVTLTQEQGVAYVARAYLLNWAVGATRFYWYTWDNRNNPFAMREADGVTLTPAGRSFQEIAAWLTGATMSAVGFDARGNRQVTLRRADGSTGHVLWNPAGSAEAVVPAEWNIARVRDLAGGTRAWSGAASIAVGPVPLLLESVAPVGGALVVDNKRAGVRDTSHIYTGGWGTSGAQASTLTQPVPAVAPPPLGTNGISSLMPAPAVIQTRPAIAAADDGIVVDNAAAGLRDSTRTFSGRWCVSVATAGYGAGSLYSCGGAQDSYRWRPLLPQAGAYDVYVWWTVHPNRATRVPIRVSHAAGTTVREFNQRAGGGAWVSHGSYAFNAGNSGYVEVSDLNGQAAADAVRFVPAGSPPPVSAGPAVLFTDAEAGPVRGGPGDAGVPLAIFGRGFGATRGTSRVTINGVEVARYLIWGQNNANNSALDMIVVQPGPAVSAGAVVVTVNGRESNATYRFTPTTGTVYAVSPTGVDTAPCSLTQPCATVLHASTNVMRAGDALLVRGGIMNDNEIWIRREYGHSGAAGRPKIIRNYPGETPVFSRGNRPFILDADYLTLSGLRFENRKSLVVGYERNQGARVYNNRFRGAIDYDAIGTHASDVVLAGNDCEVTGSSVGTQGHCYYISNGGDIALRYNIARGVPGYGIHIFDQRRAANDIVRRITNVLVEGNLLAASTQRSGLIVAMGDEDGLGNHVDGVTIRNNLFVGNNFAGVAVGGNTRNVRIHHNTFYRNGRQGVTLYDDASIDGVDLRNNLIDQTVNGSCTSNCSWYAVAHLQKGAGARNVTVAGNFYAPAPAVLIGASDAAARAGTPGFVDGANGNYHLQAGSALIDASPLLPGVPLDFDGVSRSSGVGAEAGAYEYP